MSKPADQNELANGFDDNKSKFDALCRLIQRGQGRFVLALIEYDLPSQLRQSIEDLKGAFPTLNLTLVNLTPLPADTPRTLNVLDQLKSLTQEASPDTSPDALLITGFESLLPDALDVADEQAAEQLARAIQPLNLGRNLLAESFPCPVLLFLPSSAMAVFLQSAPDLNSWRSGFYSFHSDLSPIYEECKQNAQKRLGWWKRWRLRLLPAKELQAEKKHLEDLIADAQALGVEKPIIARLYEQLGWRLVALGNRSQARGAFAELLQLALKIDDKDLIGAAERGQRAAERVIPLTKLSSDATAEVGEVFHGAAALTEAEGLYGREEELGSLLTLVTAQVEPRFLIIWGETGCGKSSLVLAGLVPELKRLGRYLPIIIRDWETADLSVRGSLENASGLSLVSCNDLYDCIAQVAQKTGQTIIIVCDQFEQFFSLHPQRGDRAQLLSSIGKCVNDLRLQCKFIFIVREDALGHLAEFDGNVPEPLEQRKRSYLPLFSSADAVRVLREMANKADLQWPDSFIRTVVADLTKDGRVRPIQLQLVAAALAFSGINDELDYARADRARGLLVDYLEVVLSGITSGKQQIEQTKRILLALVADPPGRVALNTEEISTRTGLSPGFVSERLDKLCKGHLVRRVESPESLDGSTPGAASNYELTHDVLVDLVLIVTRGLQDYRREANRILRRALEDSSVNARRRIGLRAWRLVSKYANEDEVAKPQAKALLRRSLYWGVLKKIVIPIVLFISALVVLQLSVGYVSLEQDVLNRVVVRRGHPWLWFLPGIGDRIILDTGLRNNRDLNPAQAVYLIRMLQWEVGNRQSSVLARPELINALKGPPQKALYQAQLGQEDQSLKDLEDQLRKKTQAREKDRADAKVRADEFAKAYQKAASVKIVSKRLREIVPTEKEVTPEEKSRIAENAEIRAKRFDYQTELNEFLPLLGDLVLTNPDSADRVFEILKPLAPRLSPELSHVMQRVVQAKPALGEPIVNLLLQHSEPSENTDPASDYPNEDDYYPNGRYYPDYQDYRILQRYGYVQSTQYNPEQRDYVQTTKRWFSPGDYRSGPLALTLGSAAKDDPQLVRLIIDHYLTAINQSRVKQPLQTDGSFNQLSYRYARYRSGLYNQFEQVVKELGTADPPAAIDRYLGLLDSEDERLRIAAVGGLGQVARAEPRFAERTTNALLKALNDDKHNSINRTLGLGTSAYLAGIEALDKAVQADPKVAGKVAGYLLGGLKASDLSVRVSAVKASGDLAQADPTQAFNVIERLLNEQSFSLLQLEHDYYYYSGLDVSIASALGKAAKADHASIDKVLSRSLEQLTSSDIRPQAKRGTLSVLGDLVEADPRVASKIVDPLLTALKSPDLTVGALQALVKAVQADPKLASKTIDPLLLLLKDWNFKEEAAEALVKVAEADAPSANRIVESLLHGTDVELRWKAQWVLGGLAQVNSEARTAALQMLSSPDADVRNVVSTPVSALLLKLANEDKHPDQFLLEHLEGKRSLLEKEEANTNATYRSVVIKALAQWVVTKDKATQLERETLMQRLIQMHHQDERAHLRIAAWEILVRAAQLRDSPEELSDNE